MYWKVSGWKLCLSGQKFLHTHKTLAKCTTSIALSFDSLLLRGISADLVLGRHMGAHDAACVYDAALAGKNKVLH